MLTELVWLTFLFGAALVLAYFLVPALIVALLRGLPR